MVVAAVEGSAIFSKNDARVTLRIILGLQKVVSAAEDSAIFSTNDAEVTSRTIFGLQTMVSAVEGSAIFLKNDARVTLRIILGLKRKFQTTEIPYAQVLPHVQIFKNHDYFTISVSNHASSKYFFHLNKRITINNFHLQKNQNVL